MADKLRRGVVRRAEGEYVVRWLDTDGAQQRKVFRRGRDGRTAPQVRKAAEEWKEDREHARRSGEREVIQTPGGAPMAEVIEAWLERDARPSTIARDRSFARSWLLPDGGRPGKRLGSRRVRDVRPDHVQGLVDEWLDAGRKPETVRSYYGRMSALFAFAVKRKFRADSPCHGIDRVPHALDRKERPEITWEDIHRLADALPEQYRPVAYLAALGLRRAEVFGVQVGDLDFARSTVTVRRTVTPVEGRLEVGPPKTQRSRRTIQVPVDLMVFLGDFVAEQGRVLGDHLLTAPEGGPVRPDLFRRRVWQPACIAADLGELAGPQKSYLGLGLHDLRHAAVALMREAGVPLEVASRRLGHSSIRTTADIYGSLPKQLDEEAADALGSAMARPSRPAQVSGL